ncbi:hypothetical protein R1flu_000138 [Riccia fluitans]|uniref:DUF7869 domain-containing protein n=1 Tax=Riccia fluitans TaxID=41844 RepID=A0ABD1XZK3_9MARC
MFLKKKIFKKVKLGLLLVGHTHDQIDQMFNRFFIKLVHKKAFTLSALMEIPENAYLPSLIGKWLDDLLDFKKFTEDAESPALRNLNNITFNQ